MVLATVVLATCGRTATAPEMQRLQARQAAVTTPWCAGDRAGRPAPVGPLLAHSHSWGRPRRLSRGRLPGVAGRPRARRRLPASSGCEPRESQGAPSTRPRSPQGPVSAAADSKGSMWPRRAAPGRAGDTACSRRGPACHQPVPPSGAPQLHSAVSPSPMSAPQAAGTPFLSAGAHYAPQNSCVELLPSVPPSVADLDTECGRRARKPRSHGRPGPA